MAVELIGAKMMAPYFGSSLYVWATVLAVTLFALTSGYFVGGLLSEKNNRENILYTLALIGSAFMIVMPNWCYLLFYWFGNWRLIPATLLSAFGLLFPPVFIMGNISPLIISVLEPYFKKSGRTAGIVYAISTLGGITGTFLCGFYLIPMFGLKWPCMAFGALFSIIPLTSLLKKKQSNAVSFLVFIIVYSFWQTDLFPKQYKGLKPILTQEGILGQVMVIDYLPTNDTSVWQGRVLTVNRIIQTAEDSRPNRYPYLAYIKEIERVLDSIPSLKNLKNKKHALVNGLGGGSLAKMLHKRGFTVTAVELDERIINTAKNYFNLPNSIYTITDDARHYLNTTQQPQELIIFDLFKGEENPGHVLTLESFSKIHQLLNDNGIIIINTHGYISGITGKGNRSIIKTMLKAGFTPLILPVEKNARAEDFRNLLIIALKNKNDYQLLTHKLNNELIIYNSSFLNDAIVLTDNKPVLDYLNARASRLWRYYYMQDVVKFFNYSGIPVFN
jgi:2-polyprenyl-3-methyl-5-hydroxy-6-metoxy-1,4-benzoquinol methylase